VEWSRKDSLVQFIWKVLWVWEVRARREWEECMKHGKGDSACCLRAGFLPKSTIGVLPVPYLAVMAEKFTSYPSGTSFKPNIGFLSCIFPNSVTFPKSFIRPSLFGSYSGAIPFVWKRLSVLGMHLDRSGEEECLCGVYLCLDHTVGSTFQATNRFS